MSIRSIPSLTAFLLATAVVCSAQAQTAGSGEKSLASTLNVYVFPNAGQAPDQQSKDEGECYNWAVQNTGSDPFDVAKQQQQQQEQTAQQMEEAKKTDKGSGAKGALGGAAAGALIGGIAGGDAGKGAVIGAGVGLLGGRALGRNKEKKATQQVEQQGQAASQASATQIENFKKAFSVCLESKKYMVKY